MSKLARKFVLRLSALLIAVLLLTFYLNSNFIGRYYLYQEKKDMNRICSLLLDAAGKTGTGAASEPGSIAGAGVQPQTESDLSEVIKAVEASEDVVIAMISNTEDNNLLNERLRQAFLDKGLGLDKYWLWAQDQQDLTTQGRKMKLYHQPKLHYSLLVEYLDTGDVFLAAAKIIPAMSPVTSLANQMLAVVMSGAGIVMILLLMILVKKITMPLSLIGKTAGSIANLDFQTIHIKTGDELEQLAEDINQMSCRLQTAHAELEDKNRQMETLLDNVSHDLKTPISLIKAYACGMKDGLDDGTFLDTIINQNELMELMVQQLLDLSRMKQKALAPVPVNVGRFIRDLVSQYEQPAAEAGLQFHLDLQDSLTLAADLDILRTLFSNLISNAVKYTEGTDIYISLHEEEETFRFAVKNRISSTHPPDTGRIFEPFYVGEASRNRHMSGTGLGLSIVKAAALQCGYDCRCLAEDSFITFELLVIPLKSVK